MLVGVSIGAVIVTMAVRNYKRVHEEAAAQACVTSLQVIVGLKNIWAEEMKKPTNSIPTDADLIPFMANHKLPECGAGGTYTYNRLDQNPTCSMAQYGHHL